MGYMVHHAIIVTSWSGECIEEAHSKASELFGEMVSGIVKSKVNGYRSFLIAPDGSKSGWEDSNEGDANRDSFIQWVDAKREDNYLPLDWVEVQYADDECDTRIVRDSDHDLSQR